MRFGALRAALIQCQQHLNRRIMWVGAETLGGITIGQRHADTAAWRRYLVDVGFLDREAGVYWRSGGSVTSEPSS